MFKKDGTFVKEFQVEPQTLQNGSLWDLVLSEDRAQRYIFVTDGANMQVPTIDRQTDLKLGTFGRPGHMAGNFKWVHNMAIDSKGTIYTAEVGDGRRVQKFKAQQLKREPSGAESAAEGPRDRCEAGDCSR